MEAQGGDEVTTSKLCTECRKPARLLNAYDLCLRCAPGIGFFDHEQSVPIAEIDQLLLDARALVHAGVVPEPVLAQVALLQMPRNCETKTATSSITSTMRRCFLHLNLGRLLSVILGEVVDKVVLLVVVVDKVVGKVVVVVVDKVVGKVVVVVVERRQLKSILSPIRT